MEVRNGHVPEDQYRSFVEHFPQVCVELVLETEDGVLLAKRVTEPTEWFWPGSRLYKGERLADATHRIADEELGIEIEIAERLGVHSHFWDAGETRHGLGRHTVNVVYRVRPASPDFEIELNDEHSHYRFVDEIRDEYHEYVQEYLTCYDLLDREPGAQG